MLQQKLFVVIILLCIVNIYSFKISSLGFGGKGSRKTSLKKNYRYEFSTGFQKQLCTSCSDSNCWGAQGISKYSDYITRSFYQKGNTNECNGKYTDGRAKNTMIAISVIKKVKFSYLKKTVKYSNILVDSGYCHAGDHVLRKIDDTYYFFIACTSWVAIFSEDDIQKLDKPMNVNGKDFYYFVPNKAVTQKLPNEADDVSFSYISRNSGKENEYYVGGWDMLGNLDGSENKINMKLIKIDPDTDWEITVITSYTTKGVFTNAVQGATRVGDDMYLVTSMYVNRCEINDHVIEWCRPYCGLVQGIGMSGTDLVLQGAETDSNDDLFIGSEFGASWKPYGAAPFWEINNVKNDGGLNCFGVGDGIQLAQEAPYNNIERPQSIPTTDTVEWRINYQTIVFILLLCAVMFTMGMSCMTYCSMKNDKIKHYQSVKMVSDSDI